MTKEQDIEIARLKIEGHSQCDIAKTVGCSQQNVSKILRREDIKAVVDAAHQLIAQAATDAADSMVESARYYRDYIMNVRRGVKPEQEPDRQLLDFGYKASREIGRATGSLAGENVSVFIHNVYSQQANLFANPAIRQVLEAFGESLRLPDADDDEYA